MAMQASELKNQNYKKAIGEELLLGAIRQSSPDWDFLEEIRGQRQERLKERVLLEEQVSAQPLYEEALDARPVIRRHDSAMVDISLFMLAVAVAGGLVLANNIVPQQINIIPDKMSQLMDKMDNLYQLGYTWAVIDTDPDKGEGDLHIR